MPMTPEFSPVDDPGDVRADASRTSASERVRALIDTVDAAARDLRSTQGLDHTLELVVKGAVASVPGAEEAGITLVDRRGNVSSESPTSPVVADLDGMQAELHEGPCIDSAFDAEQVTVVDLDTVEHRERWPRFAPAATRRGVSSMMAVELFREPGTTGALNMYAADPGAFDRDSREVGALFASHAAIALFGAQRAENLTARAASRDLIGQAKGVLMARHQVDDHEAFQMLVRASNDRRTKLTDLAREITDAARHGHTPPGPTSGRAAGP